MDLQKNQMIAIVVCIVAAVVICGAAAIMMNHNDSDGKSLPDLSKAELKVLGNLDLDNKIDENDLTILKNKVSEGVSYESCSIADVNNDRVIDEKDITALENILAAINDSTHTKKATIWHYNYHDTDGDGQMDVELVSTSFPITSTIITGSANTFVLLYTLGIVDEVKGASYSSTNDKWLFGDTYLDTTKVVKLGTSAQEIKFEDGKAGSSDVIQKEGVTTVISDWNRTYLTNEEDFEKANIDVVRVSAASFEPSVYTHSICLLGLLFDKKDNAEKLLTYYNEAYNDIKNAVSTLPADKIKKAVVSSSDGSISSGDSDYTAFCIAAGAKFGLEGYDFGGSTSIKVADNLGIFDTRNYNFDNIVHIRTALTYNSTTSDLAGYWSTYANAMSLWEHAYDGQVLVSGTIPVPARIAYIAYAIYGAEVDALNLDWANGIHSKLASLYRKDVTEAPNQSLVLNSYKYKVTVEDGVVVKNEKGETITSGDEFPYGTKLFLSATETKPGYVLRADGSTLNEDGSFLVCDNVRARYVDQSIIDKLTSTADAFVKAYGEGVYGKASSVADNEGVFTMSGTYYNGTKTSKDLKFTYLDTPELAKEKYAELETACKEKGKFVLDVSSVSDKFDGIYVKFTSSISAKSPYIGSTIYLCAYKGNMVIDMVGTYLSNYYYDDTTYEKYKDDADACKAFFQDGALEFVTALATALESA